MMPKIPVEVTLEAEDIGSLLQFIDHFLPMVNTDDPDSKETAVTIHNVRNSLHDALGDMGDEIARTDPPV